jgi:effector-binding domain-containing protein
LQYEFILEDKLAQPTICIRTRTPVGNLPHILGNAFESLINYLAETDTIPTYAPYVGYFNMDMQDLDIEIGYPVAQPLAGKNELKSSEIPAGKQVSCIYTGPYNKIEPAYEAIMKWITENGYTPTGVCYEFYLNDPHTTPENELLTKIVFLLN